MMFLEKSGVAYRRSKTLRCLEISMVIPNLLGLLALSGIVVKLAQDRDNTRLTSEHFEDNTERRETTND